MKQITSFPYKISFSYKTYECGKVYKVKGKHIQEILLQDGNFLRNLNPEQQLKLGINCNTSKVKTGDHSFDVISVITIENKNALPVEIRWFSESSYADRRGREEFDGRKYLTRVFIDDINGEVKKETLNGWYYHQCTSPLKK